MMIGCNFKNIINKNTIRKTIKRKNRRGIIKTRRVNFTSNKNIPLRTTTEVEVEEEEEGFKEDLIIKGTTNWRKRQSLSKTIETISENRRGDRMILKSIKRDSTHMVNRRKKKNYHKRGLRRRNFNMLKEI